MFEWLKDFRELQNDITRLENNLDRNKKELRRWVSGDLAKYKLTTESHGAQLEEIIEAIEYELAHKMNDIQDMKRMISAFEGLENKIVYMKHVEGMTLEKIAIELQYSAQYIYNKHAQIRRMMKFAQKIT